MSPMQYTKSYDTMLRGNFMNITPKWRISSYIIIGVFTIFLFLNSLYGDFYITLANSLGVWDALFDGNLLDFYSYTAPGNSAFVAEYDLLYYSGAAAYDFPLYLIFAIWNFPVWILSRIFHLIIFGSIKCLLYAKSIILAFYFVNLLYLNKILAVIGKDSFRFPVFILYMTSPFILIYSIANGNYDIIASAFCLIAFYHFIQGQNKRFLFWLSVCVSMKYYPFFLLFPLILLKEKKILLIIRDIIAASSITLLSKLLFSRNGVAATQLISFSYFQGNQLLNGSATIILFFFLYALLCIIIWQFINEDTFGNHDSIAVYICLLAGLIFFLFAGTNPYWIVILVPFLILSITIQPENLLPSSFSLMLFSVLHSLHLLLTVPWVPNGDIFINFPIFRLVGYKICDILGRLETGLSIGYYLAEWSNGIGLPHATVNSLGMVFLILLLLLCNPYKKIQCRSSQTVLRSGSLLLLLILLPIIISYLPLVTYVEEIIRIGTMWHIF